MDALNVRDLEIGRFNGNERVTLDVRIERTPDTWQTVEHESVTDPWRLSISGSTWWRQTCRSAGQIHDEVSKLYWAGKAHSSELKVILNAWTEWHLNDLQAGCAHQGVIYALDRYGRMSPSLELTEPCPITGYRYGSAWLVEPLPEDVGAEIHRAVSALREAVKERANA